MSRCQNVTLSDELAKRKMKIADMERELAAEHERVRKEEEEEEHARNIFVIEFNPPRYQIFVISLIRISAEFPAYNSHDE